MAIIKTVDLHDFREAFRACGRTEQFSHEGLEVLFNYLEDMSDSTDEPLDLDVIGLCCGYSEDTPEEIAEYYSIELPEREDFEDEDDYRYSVGVAVLDYLSAHTSVCGITDNATIVYASF